MEKNRIRFIKDYLVFLSKSANAYGLHSPFVYSLATKCLYDKEPYETYQILKKYQKELAKDRRMVVPRNLGAGLKKNSHEKIGIHEISSATGIDLKKMKLFHRLVKYFNPKSILELGTSLGKATISMASADVSARVITVEKNKTIADVSAYYFDKYGLENIDLMLTTFDLYLDEIAQSKQKFDFILINGKHQCESIPDCFERLLPKTHNDTLVILNDIYRSSEMKKTWRSIQKHKCVRQTIDVFHFGLVFFRKEQFKEHFIIRI